ncbi:MAG: hypothetical protein JKY83_06435 [Rhizobiaceae bacterium]|nr:hypothetical protein [Rhizobiaceae bacterium]
MTICLSKSRFAGAILTVWAGTTALANNHENFDQIPASDTPYVQVAALGTNIVNDARKIARMDRLTGVSQIASLLRRTNYEEQWAFIPTANLWLEIGKNEISTGEDSSVELDFEYLKSIAGIYDEIHILHFHPSSYYKQGIWADSQFDVNFPAKDLQGDEVTPIGLALPSSADVASTVQMVELLSDAHPETKLKFTVVSPHGQVSYGPTKIGKQKLIFHRGNPRRNFLRDIAVRTILRRSPRNIKRTIKNLRSPNIGDVISELCKQMSGEDYLVTFEPNK